MKKILVSFFGLVIAGAFSFALADEIDLDALVKNQWECEATFMDKASGMTIRTKSLDSYARDSVYSSRGTANSTGTLEIKINGFNELIIYAFSGSSSWEIKGEYMIFTDNLFKTESVSNPQSNEFFNSEDLYPKDMVVLSKILKINDKEFVVQEGLTGAIEKCVAVGKK